MDLVGRKLADGGTAAMALLDEILDGAKAAQATEPELAHQVWQAAETLREATLELLERDLPERFSGAVPYLSAFARVLGAAYHALAAMRGGNAALARVYITRILPHYAGDLAAARAGLADLEALDDAVFAGQMAG